MLGNKQEFELRNYVKRKSNSDRCWVWINGLNFASPRTCYEMSVTLRHF